MVSRDVGDLSALVRLFLLFQRPNQCTSANNRRRKHGQKGNGRTVGKGAEGVCTCAAYWGDYADQRSVGVPENVGWMIAVAGVCHLLYMFLP